MKILTIGDVHGRNYWKDIDPLKYDLIIFVGDYTDSFTLGNLEIKKNLLDIIEFAKTNSDKVILLLGNHDLPYFWGEAHNISGFRPEAIWDLNIIFRENRKLFKTAHQIDNYIWTHAGIHEGWYKKHMPDAIKKYELTGNLADQLNHLFERNFDPLFAISHYRGGSAREGGPFWTDWNEMYKKPLPGYNHIFGHSFRDKPIKTYNINKNTTITCVDRGVIPEFYELII